MKQEMICICCPLGCRMTVCKEPEGTITVTGNTCPRGRQYAEKEVTAPTRVVTSTVAVSGAVCPRVCVKTAQDIPKEKIFDVMREIRRTKACAPVHIGNVILQNCADTGVDVVATSNAPAEPHNAHDAPKIESPLR